MSPLSLELDDAPPISIVLPFFLTGPVFIALAGILLLVQGESALVSSWSPATVVLTHLGTLGFLLMTMLGAIYQLAPMVAVTRVPGLRLAHGVYLLIALGVLGFALAGFFQSGQFLAWGSWCVIAGLTLFLPPTAWAFFRINRSGTTLWGMRTALFALLVTGLLGFLMARGYENRASVNDRGLWIQVHLSLGLLCWCGGLIAAVSWKVVPMFYLARGIDPSFSRCIGLGVGLSIVLLPLVVFLPPEVGPRETRLAATIAAVPAALATWLLHPIAILRALATKNSHRSDATMEFWRTW